MKDTTPVFKPFSKPYLQYTENNTKVKDFMGSIVRELQEIYGFDTKKLLDSNNFDGHWKAFTEYYKKEVVMYCTPPEILKDLDLDRILTANKEHQYLFRQVVGVQNDQVFFDKLFQVPYKNNPDKYYCLHLEFQTLADGEFTVRMADYMLLRKVNDGNLCRSYAFVSRKRKSYSNQYVIGLPDNGIKVQFEDHIIFESPESRYKIPDCIVSQALYAVWLYEHRKKISMDILESKFYGLFENIAKFGYKGEKFLSILLFVLKYAQGCFPDLENFHTFVHKVFSLLPNNNPMTVIEKIKNEGKLEGVKKGRIEGKQEGRLEGIQEGRLEGIQEGRLEGMQEGRLEGKIEVAKRMLVDSKYPVEEIARILNVSVEKILETKASL